MPADAGRVSLPAGCYVIQGPGGQRVLRMRNTGARILIAILGTSGLVTVAVALALSTGDRDPFATVACVALPIVLGPLVGYLALGLVTRHELVLSADGVVHRRIPFGGPPQSTRVVELGVVHSPATADSGDVYFLGVVHPGSNLAVVPGWSSDVHELQRLGEWLQRETGVPFGPEPVTRV